MQELNDPEQVSLTWVKHLYGLVDQFNDTKTQMTGMSPLEATELKKILLIECYPMEDTLPEDGLYHYVLQPGKEYDDQQHRAADRIWSKTTHRWREVVLDSGNRVMYYLSDGPDRAFVSDELMLIPEDTDCLWITLKNGNIYPTGINIAMADWRSGLCEACGTCGVLADWRSGPVKLLAAANANYSREPFFSFQPY